MVLSTLNCNRNQPTALQTRHPSDLLLYNALGDCQNSAFPRSSGTHRANSSLNDKLLETCELRCTIGVNKPFKHEARAMFAALPQRKHASPRARSTAQWYLEDECPFIPKIIREPQIHPMGEIRSY